MADLRIADLVDRTTFRPDGTIGMSGARITGARVVAEQVARAWLSDRGDMRHAEQIGVNLQRLRNSAKTPAELRRWEMALRAEARAVEFVADARVTLRIVGKTLIVRGEILLIDGLTYTLAVSLDEASSVVASFGVAA